MEPRLMNIKAKKIGLFLCQAREKSKASVSECALWLGIPENEYESIEAGKTLLSLPQIESLSYFLNCSFDTLTVDGIEDQKEIFTNPAINLELLKLRDKIIAVSLKQIRLKKNLSVEDLANLVSLPVETIEYYENGRSPIPFLHLESILEALQISSQQFFSQSGPFSLQHETETPKNDSPAIDLPEELLGFISKPVNRPYLELAMKLSQMEAEKLRAIAASLLEITY
jgi:transcriptional regulator with XRE-family HTH domain